MDNTKKRLHTFHFPLSMYLDVANLGLFFEIYKFLYQNFIYP